MRAIPGAFSPAVALESLPCKTLCSFPNSRWLNELGQFLSVCCKGFFILFFTSPLSTGSSDALPPREAECSLQRKSSSPSVSSGAEPWQAPGDVAKVTAGALSLFL